MQLVSENDIVNHLRREVYVRIGRSEIHGVGVFAIRDIPQGVDPFQEVELGFAYTPVHAALIFDDPQIPELVKKYVKDMCAVRDEIVNFPRRGMNSITALYLLNHSAEPNMHVREDLVFETTREINAGEELTIDYHTYSEEEQVE